jgi:hypothetical protein
VFKSWRRKWLSWLAFLWFFSVTPRNSIIVFKSCLHPFQLIIQQSSSYSVPSDSVIKAQIKCKHSGLIFRNSNFKTINTYRIMPAWGQKCEQMEGPKEMLPLVWNSFCPDDGKIKVLCSD